MTESIWAQRRVRGVVGVAIGLMLLLLAVVILLNHEAMGQAPAYSNTTLLAPASVLGFLAAAAGLVFSAVVVAWALAVGNRRVAGGMLTIAGAGVALYAAALLGFSLTSSGTLLAPGMEKYFCEIDCHLAYSVVNVTTTKSMATAQGEQRAAGTFYVVTLKTRFDEKTIAPWRGDAPLTPSPRALAVVDDAGATYSPRGYDGTDLMTPLRPGQSYTTDVIFDLPDGAQNPRLLLTSRVAWPDRLLIGGESSFLHKQAQFRLPGGGSS